MFGVNKLNQYDNLSPSGEDIRVQICLGYSRISDEDSASDQALAQQDDLLRNSGVDELFSDYQSGLDDDRPQFQALLSRAIALTRQGIKVKVVVARQDRFSRKMATCVGEIERLESFGVEIYALDSGRVSVASAIEWLKTAQLGMIAEFYVRQLSANVRRGYAYARSVGKPMGGKPPIGYKRSSDKTKLELDDSIHESGKFYHQIVREIFEKAIDGHPLRAISKWLYESYGVKRSSSGIRKILNNPVYRGHLCYSSEGLTRKDKKDGKETEKRQKLTILYNRHHPICSESEYDLICQALKQNREQWGINASSDRDIVPLSGLVFCASCGRRMFSSKQVKRGTVYRYFRCVVLDCQNKGTLRYEAIESAVKVALTQKAEQLATDLLNTPNSETKIDPVLLELKRQLKELKEMYARTPLQGLQSAIEEIKYRIEAIEHQSQVESSNSISKQELLTNLSSVDFWDDFDLSEKRFAYRELIEGIWILDRQVTEIKLKV